MNCQPLYKVTAYVTRGEGSGRQLLVFRDAHAGVQQPAGTVDDGEDPADAVLRETSEETGLDSVEIVRLLHVQETNVPEPFAAVLDPIALFAGPSEDAEPSPGSIGRSGPWVEVVARDGLYARVSGVRAGAVDDADRVTGWVRCDALTNRIVRRHYELRALGPTPDRWTHCAESACEVCWVALDDAGLVASNAEWLSLVLPALTGA